MRWTRRNKWPRLGVVGFFGGPHPPITAAIPPVENKSLSTAAVRPPIPSCDDYCNIPFFIRISGVANPGPDVYCACVQHGEGVWIISSSLDINQDYNMVCDEEVGGFVSLETATVQVDFYDNNECQTPFETDFLTGHLRSVCATIEGVSRFTTQIISENAPFLNLFLGDVPINLTVESVGGGIEASNVLDCTTNQADVTTNGIAQGFITV